MGASQTIKITRIKTYYRKKGSNKKKTQSVGAKRKPISFQSKTSSKNNKKGKGQKRCPTCGKFM